MDSVAPSRNLELQLLRELNAGTFARLYVAQARGGGGLERLVAVKLLREQWAESVEIVDRTRDEARLLARLRHKNIVRVEELAEIEGQPAIIMEFVDGLDLKQLVEVLQQRNEKVPPRVALQVVLETASALEAAWSKATYGTDKPLHVVHRDIKPSNVMVSVEGELKVLDFGTARSSQAFRAAQTGALRFGSLKYMSPERREGDRGEHPADVYALGLMAAELLQNAWEPLLPLDTGEHDEAVLQWIGRLPDTGMPNREWDLALRKVLVQMMASDPTIRPGADQVVKLMRAFVDQAMGPTLEAFAADKVLPLTRELRMPVTAGTLAGTRVTVQIRGEPDRVPDSPIPSADPPAPRLIVRSKADGLQTNPPPEARPPDLGPPPRPAPDAPRKTGGIPLKIGGGAAKSPAPHAPPLLPARPDAPGEMTNVRPLTPPPRPEPAPILQSYGPPVGSPKQAGSSVGLVAALVVALGLGAGLVGLILVAAALVMYPSNPTGGTTGASPPAETVPPGTPASGGVPLTVTLNGIEAQWVRVEDGAGKSILSGKDKLTGTLPPGAYTLAVKPVGKTALRGAITIETSALSLSCSRTDAVTSCSGGAGTLTLR